MSIAPTTSKLHAEDLPYDAPGEGLSELVGGDVVREPPPGEAHGRFAGNVFGMLWSFVREHQLGAVYAAETGFVLARNPDTVRAPDAAFVSRERLRAEERSREARRGPYFEGAPDLAVEVLSPGDAPAAVADKVRDFLAAGSAAVWVIDPHERTLTVHRRDHLPRTFTEDDTLDAEPAVPGFRLRVGEIFEP